MRSPGAAAPPVALTQPLTAVLDEYMAALKLAPLSEQTRRTFISTVRQFLAWLADGDTAGDR